MTGNKFLTVERLRKRAEKYHEHPSNKSNSGDVARYYRYLAEKSGLSKVIPRSALKLDEDMAKAMEKMKQKRELMNYLPGFDCGGCGSPTCQALAEDIVQGFADISHCIFMQKILQRNEKLSVENAMSVVEKIWGKDRLDKKSDTLERENE